MFKDFILAFLDGRVELFGQYSWRALVKYEHLCENILNLACSLGDAV